MSGPRRAGPVSIPERPKGLPYADGGDFDARAILEERGEATDPASLVGVLREGEPMLQAAAARTLGADGHAEAADALRRLAADAAAEEVARAQAAYALARLGLDEGREALVELLDVPREASPASLVAAGALARLGDARGLALVRAELRAKGGAWATVAVQQLHAFLPLAGGAADADVVYEVAGLALAHGSEAVRTEAQLQLSDEQVERARAAAR